MYLEKNFIDYSSISVHKKESKNEYFLDEKFVHVKWLCHLKSEEKN